MNLAVTFAVHGRPASQGSKRHVGNGVMVESCKRLAIWRQDVRLAAARAIPDGWNLAAPVQVNATFSFVRPKAHYRTGKNAALLKETAPQHCLVRLDVDKMARALNDALSGPVLLDDSQIVVLIAQKRWALDGTESTSATITML
jgi:Holliday junction resolvase RusA-like endonuclease